jgi:hypothetical protein
VVEFPYIIRVYDATPLYHSFPKFLQADAGLVYLSKQQISTPLNYAIFYFTAYQHAVTKVLSEAKPFEFCI